MAASVHIRMLRREAQNLSAGVGRTFKSVPRITTTNDVR
jgi:hypothetical protein